MAFTVFHGALSIKIIWNRHFSPTRREAKAKHTQKKRAMRWIKRWGKIVWAQRCIDDSFRGVEPLRIADFFFIHQICIHHQERCNVYLRPTNVYQWKRIFFISLFIRKRFLPNFQFVSSLHVLLFSFYFGSYKQTRIFFPLVLENGLGWKISVIILINAAIVRHLGVDCKWRRRRKVGGSLVSCQAVKLRSHSPPTSHRKKQNRLKRKLFANFHLNSRYLHNEFLKIIFRLSVLMFSRFCLHLNIEERGLSIKIFFHKLQIVYCWESRGTERGEIKIYGIKIYGISAERHMNFEPIKIYIFSIIRWRGRE